MKAFVLYAPTSPNIVIEFVKTIVALCDSRDTHIFIVRPGGLAAQVGIPEAWKKAHKEGFSLGVLPDLKDVVEIYSPSEIYVVAKTDKQVNTAELKMGQHDKKIMFIFPSGEQPFKINTKDLADKIRYIYFDNVKKELNPIASLSILIYSILK